MESLVHWVSDPRVWTTAFAIGLSWLIVVGLTCAVRIRQLKRAPSTAALAVVALQVEQSLRSLHTLAGLARWSGCWVRWLA